MRVLLPLLQHRYPALLLLVVLLMLLTSQRVLLGGIKSRATTALTAPVCFSREE